MTEPTPRPRSAQTRGFAQVGAASVTRSAECYRRQYGRFHRPEVSRADAVNLHPISSTRRQREEPDDELSGQRWRLEAKDGPVEDTSTTCVSPPLAAPGEPDAMRTARERAEQKRQEKLELVREQLESGSLVIRQMTAEEHRQYPPRPAPPDRPRSAPPDGLRRR